MRGEQLLGHRGLPILRASEVVRDGCFSSGFSMRASLDNTFAVIPVHGERSAIWVVAGARNHQNRLVSPSWSRSSDRGANLPDPVPETSHQPNSWEFGGNGGENLVGKSESDRISRKPPQASFARTSALGIDIALIYSFSR